MTNKIEFDFNIKTANQDEKVRTLLGKLIAFILNISMMNILNKKSLIH